MQSKVRRPAVPASSALPHTITINVSEVMIPPSNKALFPNWNAAAVMKANAVDVWSGKSLGKVRSITRVVRPHSNIFITLEPLSSSSSYLPLRIIIFALTGSECVYSLGDGLDRSITVVILIAERRRLCRSRWWLRARRQCDNKSLIIKHEMWALTTLQRNAAATACFRPINHIRIRSKSLKF